MTPRAREPRHLATAAYRLADSYRAGDRAELGGLPWSEVFTALVRELRAQCPGFSDAELRQALDQGFSDSR